VIALWLACAKPAPPVEPLPVSPFAAAEAEARARVPDVRRGGPIIGGDASPLPPFLGVDRSTDRYVGPDVCAACHPTALAVWKETPHARAVATLEREHHAHDPACLRCHVTGLGHPGGPIPEVGCEACHGPGSAHVAAPAVGYGDLPMSMAACVACHTHDTSPDFRWEDRWARIAHGR